MAAGADVVRAAVAVLRTPEGNLDMKIDDKKLGKIPAPPVPGAFGRHTSRASIENRPTGMWLARSCDGRCGSRVFGHRQLRSACRSSSHDGNHLKVADGDTVDIVDDVRGQPLGARQDALRPCRDNGLLQSPDAQGARCRSESIHRPAV